MLKHHHIIPILLVAMMFTACSSIDCSLNGTVLCQYQMQKNNGTDSTLALPFSVILSRNITDGDTTYINLQNKVSKFGVPMSYAGETDVITLVQHSGENTAISDVIRITKTNEPYFESVDCAPRYTHTLQKAEYTENFIDTIIINQSEVTNNASTTNIYIRLRDSN